MTRFMLALCVAVMICPAIIYIFWMTTCELSNERSSCQLITLWTYALSATEWVEFYYLSLNTVFVMWVHKIMNLFIWTELYIYLNWIIWEQEVSFLIFDHIVLWIKDINACCSQKFSTTVTTIMCSFMPRYVVCIFMAIVKPYSYTLPTCHSLNLELH